MAAQKTYLAFRRTAGNVPLSIEPSTELLPENLGRDEVLIKIHAVSLNYRDVAMLHGIYPVGFEEQGIVASDCAAEVISVGTAVADFRVGDRVAPIFDLNNVTGLEDASSLALGGNGPGVLCEFAVFEARHLVHLPDYLSWEEASTIPCAGVTAWTALNSPASLARKDASALLQGTGGVSMFGLLICLAAGIRPIITSSSNEKLGSIRKLSPNVLGINYKTIDNIAAKARQLTEGKGVDIVVNNVGLTSIPNDIDALREKAGTISLIGFLEGLEVNWSPTTLFRLMNKRANLQYAKPPTRANVPSNIDFSYLRSRGIGVGSKADFEALNGFLENKKVALSPLIDKVFEFKDSLAAFEYLSSGKHVGKVVIRL